MAETSGFFNSQVDEEGTYDRVYLAGDFANYFSSLISNGIFGGKLNELQVIADSGMNVLVQTGRAFIEGYWYQNSEPLQITIPANVSGSLQFYGIAIRLDKTQRSINVVLKGPAPQGAAGQVANPIRNDSVYELTLALIMLPAYTSSIKQSLIIDERAKTNLCGFVAGLIDQIDTTEFATQLDTYITETSERIQALQDALDSDIQNITNDTPAMLKSVYDKNNDGVVDKAAAITTTAQQYINASSYSGNIMDVPDGRFWVSRYIDSGEVDYRIRGGYAEVRLKLNLSSEILPKGVLSSVCDLSNLGLLFDVPANTSIPFRFEEFMFSFENKDVADAVSKLDISLRGEGYGNIQMYWGEVASSECKHDISIVTFFIVPISE